MDKIKQQLLEEPLAKVYLIHGEDAYRQQEIYRILQLRAEQEGSMEWNWVNLTASQELQLADLITEINTSPWGSGKKIIALLDADQLGTDVLNKLANFLEKAGNVNCLAMFFSDLDKRLKAIKQLLQIGVEIECRHLSGEALIRWVQDYVSMHKRKISYEVAEKFLAKVGDDLTFIKNELDKLLLYTHEQATITDTDVSVITSIGPNQLEHGAIFDMVEAVAARQTERALAIVKELLDAKEPPLKILPLIERQLRLLLVAKFKGSISLAAAAQAMGEKEYPLKQAEKYKDKFTYAQLERGLQQVLLADSDLKRGADPYQVLEQLIISLCK